MYLIPQQEDSWRDLELVLEEKRLISESETKKHTRYWIKVSIAANYYCYYYWVDNTVWDRSTSTTTDPTVTADTTAFTSWGKLKLTLQQLIKSTSR